MQDEIKNKDIGNVSEIDEALLRDFFAQSARMTIRDDGFSRRVMRRLPEEMPMRLRLACGAWSVACAVLAVALFFFKDGFTLLKDNMGATVSGMCRRVGEWIGSLGMHSFDLPIHGVSYTTPLLAVLALFVLASVAIYNMAESE